MAQRGSGRRPQRLAEQVREVVTTFIREEARDPRIGFVTVTRVRVTADLQHARIQFVVHGDAKVRDQTLEGLNNAIPAIRRRIGHEIRLRVIPELSFEPDLGMEHAARIEQLLAGLEVREEPES
jgi:ribosome-binding factor A